MAVMSATTARAPDGVYDEPTRERVTRADAKARALGFRLAAAVHVEDARSDALLVRDPPDFMIVTRTAGLTETTFGPATLEECERWLWRDPAAL